MTKTFPTLFKKTSTGADQCWSIEVVGNTIISRWGQVGGAQQSTTDTIAEGKNGGRANATTPEAQAVLEAQSQWEKKLKRGYVQDLASAPNPNWTATGVSRWPAGCGRAPGTPLSACRISLPR